MVLSVSSVLILAVIVIALLRTGHLRFGPALAALLLGFSLASTGAAPSINQLITTVASTLANLST